MTELSSRALAARIWRDYLKRRWPGLATAMGMAALTAALTAALARLLEPATNGIFSKTPHHNLFLIPAAIVGVALLRMLAQAVQAGLTNRIGHRLVGDIQGQLYGRLLRADLTRLRAAYTGGFVSQVLYDAGLIREAATNGVVNYTQHGLTVVAMLGVMLWLDPVLTAVVFIGAPAISLVTRRFARSSRKAAKGAMEQTSVLATAMMEGLDGVKIVKIANREDEETERVAQVIRARQKHIIRGANARAYASPATEALMMVITAVVIAYAGWRAQGGGMNGGQFTAFIVALAAASQSLRQLANLQTVMSEGAAGARRLFEALDVEPTIFDAPTAMALPDGPSTIRFEDVRFAYDSGAPALDGVTLEARRGETIALVGPSGGGKSTALNLIPRFYDATAGRVSIDGHDVRDITLASLRQRIALVTQEPFLFDDTVAANIGYGREGATAEQIEAAAREAAAHDFIRELPQGYDTPVGEAGTRLSGGQRQRIAIARAFLKDAPILLLDEATSALDTESEAQVQLALERLMAGRTTVLIAHRLSTVKSADRIYVIERGKVVETGTHRALSAGGGLYARLAQAQDLESLPTEGAA